MNDKTKIEFLDTSGTPMCSESTDSGERLPQRIQLRRTKGWRKPAGAIIVARPSRWGNPWVVDPRRATQPPTNRYRATAAEAVRLYRDWILHDAPFTLDDVRAELAGHDLACWCPLVDAEGNRVPCHGDELLAIANSGKGASNE